MALLKVLAGERRGISRTDVAGGLGNFLVAVDSTSCSSAF